jgi:hypothetical protein
MKLINVFLIGSAVILPVVAYIALTSEPKPGEVHNDKLVSPSNEKPKVHGSALKDEATEGELRVNLTALGKEVAQLRADLTKLRTELHTKQGQSADPAKVTIQDPVKEAEVLAEMRKKDEEHQQQQGEALEVGFRQQTIDPNWSVNAKSLVQEALASDNIASKDIIGVECRTSMCRVELANGANSQAPRITQLPMKISEELPNILVNQTNESDGSTTTVLYLSKEEVASSDSAR